MLVNTTLLIVKYKRCDSFHPKCTIITILICYQKDFQIYYGSS